MIIYIDADGCPVKDEVYRVAKRHGVKVFVVANAILRLPPDPLYEMVVVKGRLDAADDWIAERAGLGDLVITSDIPLAGRSLENQARVLSHRGEEMTDTDIGHALATRALLDQLRQSGEITGGPPPFSKADRSRFLGKIDEILHALKRKHGGGQGQ